MKIGDLVKMKDPCHWGYLTGLITTKPQKGSSTVLWSTAQDSAVENNIWDVWLEVINESR